MAYVAGFEHDVFISYAHIDNEPFGENRRRWISKFHEDVQTRLPMVLGNAATVWRDPRLQGNEVTWAALESYLGQSAVLVLVLSPRYVESESCRRELSCFERAVAAQRDFQLGPRRRVFKVEKLPVPRERHPETVRELPGYEFHWLDRETGESREFHLHPSRSVRLRYWPKLDDLVHDVAELLRALREPSPTPEEATRRVRVYLAATTQDVRDERERLERELKDNRYEILPDRLLPDSAPELVASVRDALAECALSIHLIGGNYGAIPEGENRSVIVLQHELAAERASQGAFEEIIWMRPNLQAREAAQVDFLRALELHAGTRDGFEFMKTDIEALKTVVLDRLRAWPQRAPPRVPDPEPATATPAAPRVGQTPPGPHEDQRPPAPPVGSIYLMCDRRDRDAAEILGRCLFEHGFEVALPLLTGNAAEVREFHEGYLRVCDVAVIFHGQSQPTWFQMKLLDLRRAPGLGRSKPLTAWVYMALPRTADKGAFASRQVEILDGFGELPVAQIVRLAQGLRGGGGP